MCFALMTSPFSNFSLLSSITQLSFFLTTPTSTSQPHLPNQREHEHIYTPLLVISLRVATHVSFFLTTPTSSRITLNTSPSFPPPPGSILITACRISSLLCWLLARRYASSMVESTAWWPSVSCSWRSTRYVACRTTILLSPSLLMRPGTRDPRNGRRDGPSLATRSPKICRGEGQRVEIVFHAFLVVDCAQCGGLSLMG
jgi:hypothetical protein